jgi:CRP-like cAMP-binding protein
MTTVQGSAGDGVSGGDVVKGKDFPLARAGERTNPDGETVANKILLSVSNNEYGKIRPFLEFVNLPQRFTLHEPHEKLKFAYFLNRGLASIVVATRGGKSVEAGVVGYEGAVGTPLAVGLSKSPLCEVMQIEGDGFRISARAFNATLQATPELQLKLSRYAVLQGMQIAQTAACNRLHDVGQRLARWLLMAQDRVNSTRLPLTHDFLATMLGTDRPSVSLAARKLQQGKAIQYDRGDVQIRNRKKLESAACECYRVVQHLNGYLGLP